MRNVVFVQTLKIASASGLLCLQKSSDRVGMVPPLGSQNVLDNSGVTASFDGMENSLLLMCLFLFNSYHKNAAGKQGKVDLNNIIRTVSKTVSSLLIKKQSSLGSAFQKKCLKTLYWVKSGALKGKRSVV